MSSLNDESKCKYVSSRGLLKSCNIIYSVNPSLPIDRLIEYPNNIYTKYKPGDTIYVCTLTLQHFINKILPTLTIPFVLVTGDCDIEIPKQIFTDTSFNIFISNPLIIHWFCQNWTGNHPKITHMPIGLDLHSMTSTNSWGDITSSHDQEEILSIISDNSPPFWERKSKCYSNFHFSIRGQYYKDRQDAIDNIPKDLIFLEPSTITRQETWLNQSEYAFIISPHGNGLDCHRTWEALCLGSIPIVKSSKIDPLFHDLPVLIVDSWSDITQKLLDDTIHKFKNTTFNYNKLTLKYYTDLFNSKKLDSPPTYSIPFKCTIGLCCYNNQQGLPDVINNIKQIIPLFINTKIIFFYDESIDNTLSILQEFKHNYPDNIDIIINSSTRSSSRTHNIAHARNNILNHIRSKYNDYQYMIMMDANEYSCIGKINTNTIKYVFNHDNIDQWDSVSFDREAGYYDTWALSFDPFVYSFFHFYDSKNVVQKMRQEFNHILSTYKSHSPNKFIPVLSAFNGFAIYKLDKFLNCFYSNIIDTSLFPPESIHKQTKYCNTNILPILNDDCEHRHFHLEAIHKNNAKIRILPQSVFHKLTHPKPSLRGPA
jgi:hypothetical protein